MDDINTQSDMISTALAYTALGWHVIPVHGVVPRADAPHLLACTCRLGAHCPPKLMGKHPVHGGWQKTHRYSRADVMATWSAEGGGNPHWNIGILTGVAGEVGWPFFVLDVDPDAGGLETMAQLTGQHGPLPRTRTHRTGSDGRHYLLLVPEGMTIRNNQRRIGPGVDIRGVGGMVVAPPSVSGKGEYSVLDDAPVGGPPPWVVAMLEMPEGFELLPAVVAEDLPDYADLDPSTQERVQRYALNGVAGAAEDYFSAPPGRGNDQLYRSACAALEIAQSPWNLVTTTDVVRELSRAAERRITALGDGRGQTPEEFRQTVRSAQNGVVGQGRPLPPDPHPVDGLAFDVSEFTNQGATGADGGGLPVKTMTLAERIRANLHTRSGLESLQPPTPLIEGVIDVGTMVVLAGQFGTFKSFATVGWACAVATGTPWMGRPVPVAKPVLYVAAEGASGIKLRVNAWERASGVTVPDHMLITLSLALNISDDDACRELLTICREFNIGMVIFDTLHRVTGGLDENSSKDMHRVTYVADALRETMGATTVYAHHTGHGATRSRGASSIEDDADCVWITRLTGDQGRDPKKPRQFEQRKTKDSALMDPFFVKLELIDGTESGVLIPVDEAGNPVSVETLADPFRAPRKVTPEEMREEAKRQEEARQDNAALIINVIIDLWSESTVGEFTQAAVRAACRERYGHRPGWGGQGYRNTFQRAWSRLEALDVVAVGSAASRYRYVPVEDRRPSLRPNQTNQG
jgi:hypothetical protein